MSCEDCDDAQSQPNSPSFTPGCESCIARALAVIGAHIESEEAKTMTEQYRTALDKCFGERWKQGHEMVKEWGAKVRRSRAGK